MYRCPVCKSELMQDGKRLVCKNNHSFDESKEGYYNLVVGKHKSQGDNSALVKSRSEFLNKGYYAHLRTTLLELINKYDIKTLCDIGCGEGYYSNYFSAYGIDVYGFDLSKAAIKHASKQSTANYAVANIFSLPLFDEQVDAVISIFTPLPKDEIYRVLKNGGIFIQVEPNVRHLFELKERLYDEVRFNELQKNEDMKLHVIEHVESEALMEIESNEDIISLLGMTPYAYKTSKEKLDKLQEVQSMTCLSSFYITVWGKNYEK